MSNVTREDNMSSPTTSSSEELNTLLSPKSLSPRDYMNLLQCQSTPESQGCSTSAGSTSETSHTKDVGEQLLQEEEEDNRKREQEMWAMLAGQAVFKLESYIFHKVLPESFIKPHIFPRHVKDMQSLIEKYTAGDEVDRLEGAAAKWDDLKNTWQWKREHAVVLATVKCAYLHIAKPLEVMMKLDKEQGDSVHNARRAFRNSLLPELHTAGGQIVDMMISAELLTVTESDNINVTNKTLMIARRAPKSAPVTVPGSRRTYPENK